MTEEKAREWPDLFAKAGMTVMIGSVLGYLAWFLSTEPIGKEQYDRFRAIKNGMSEEQVRAALGEPHFIHQRGVSPNQYCREGWAGDRHPIEDHLLIYHGGEPIVYVYFDQTNHVEHVYIGGS